MNHPWLFGWHSICARKSLGAQARLKCPLIKISSSSLELLELVSHLIWLEYSSIDNVSGRTTSRPWHDTDEKQLKANGTTLPKFKLVQFRTTNHSKQALAFMLVYISFYHCTSSTIILMVGRDRHNTQSWTSSGSEMKLASVWVRIMHQASLDKMNLRGNEIHNRKTDDIDTKNAPITSHKSTRLHLTRRLFS